MVFADEFRKRIKTRIAEATTAAKPTNRSSNKVPQVYLLSEPGCSACKALQAKKEVREKIESGVIRVLEDRTDPIYAKITREMNIMALPKLVTFMAPFGWQEIAIESEEEECETCKRSAGVAMAIATGKELGYNAECDELLRRAKEEDLDENYIIDTVIALLERDGHTQDKEALEEVKILMNS
jgi:hypothetical protein